MAYTTLTLMDQGALDLDAPLADYLEGRSEMPSDFRCARREVVVLLPREIV